MEMCEVMEKAEAVESDFVRGGKPAELWRAADAGDTPSTP